MITIKCDTCGKSFTEGILEDDFEIQEMHHINFIGGYTSVFGDGQRVKLDICQRCLLSIIGDFLIEGNFFPKPEGENV